MASSSSEICASVRGLDDKFLTHLALVSSGADCTGWEDVVDVVVVADVIGVDV